MKTFLKIMAPGLRRFFDPNVKTALRRGMEFISNRYPVFSVSNARLQAEEPSRYVFAVFYNDPQILVIPGRYKLVAVARGGDTIEELEISPESPYRVRSLK